MFLVLVFVAWFGVYRIWPFMVRYFERMQESNEKMSASFLKSLKERDEGMATLVKEMKARDENLGRFAENMGRFADTMREIVANQERSSQLQGKTAEFLNSIFVEVSEHRVLIEAVNQRVSKISEQIERERKERKGN
jgi:methyl-accepting chemotaxis protein